MPIIRLRIWWVDSLKEGVLWQKLASSVMVTWQWQLWLRRNEKELLQEGMKHIWNIKNQSHLVLWKCNASSAWPMGSEVAVQAVGNLHILYSVASWRVLALHGHLQSQDWKAAWWGGQLKRVLLVLFTLGPGPRRKQQIIAAFTLCCHSHWFCRFTLRPFCCYLCPSGSSSMGWSQLLEASNELTSVLDMD